MTTADSGAVGADHDAFATRWGYCDRCSKWILSGHFDVPSEHTARCPVCAAEMQIVERRAGDALVLDLMVEIPANAAEPAF